MKRTLAAAASDSTDSEVEFKILTERFCALAEPYGYNIRPYLAADLPLFHVLDKERQKIILGHFRDYVEVASAISASGQDIADTPLFVLRMIKRLGIEVSSDLFDKMTSESIVEIYDLRNIQIFRNLNFFAISSYTLEELLVREWWQLYAREDLINREIFLWASRVLKGETKNTVSPSIPRHTLIEKESLCKFEMYVDIDYFSPATLNDNPAGIVCIERAEVYKADKTRLNQVQDIE
jgi:hypothetical protein